MEKQVLQEQLFSESLPTAKDVQNGVLFRRECGKLMGVLRSYCCHDTVFENAPPAAALLVEFLPDSITSSYPAPPSCPRAYEQYE